MAGMETYCREYLLAIAHAYADAMGLAMTTVARRFHGADTFFDKFETGAITITLRKYDEMILNFHNQWPDDAKWPNGGTIRLKKSWVKNLKG